MIWTRTTGAVLAVTCLWGQAFSLDIRPFFQKQTAASEISTLQSLWRGLKIGTATGLSAGWVLNQGSENTLHSTGIGAAIGTGLGAVSTLIGKPEITSQAYSDISYGTRLGSTAGLLWGTVSALASGKSEQVGEGTAWGELIGTAFGLGYALYAAATGTYTASLKQVIPRRPPFLGTGPGPRHSNPDIILLRYYF